MWRNFDDDDIYLISHLPEGVYYRKYYKTEDIKKKFNARLKSGVFGGQY